MCRHDVIGHLDHEHPAAGAPLFSFRQLITSHVANEVRIMKPFARNLCLATKKVLFARVAVGKAIVAVKDEIYIMVEIQYRRRISHRQESDRPVALAIKMLVPSVERRREERAFAPLESLLFASLLPHRRRSTAADDEHQLLEHMLLWLKRFAWGNLADITIVDSFRAFQVEIHPAAADAGPRK